MHSLRAWAGHDESRTRDDLTMNKKDHHGPTPCKRDETWRQDVAPFHGVEHDRDV
jgi:hypothetical protein